MLISSAEANRLLRKYNDRLGNLMRTEDRTAFFVAASTEDPEKVRPARDNNAIWAEFDLLQEKIRKVKHAISCYNVSTVLEEFDMTIDQMLVYLPQLTKQVELFSRRSNELPITRSRSERFGSPLIEYCIANYDIPEMQQRYADAYDRLQRAQAALDSANGKPAIELELDPEEVI